MAKIQQVTPFMHVPDLEEALRFFRDLLGFRVLLRDGPYAYVHRDGAGFRILEGKGDDAAPPGHGLYAYYLDVEDVDQMYADLQPKLAQWPGEASGLMDMPWGQREFTLRAPDGNQLAIGAPLPKA